jgi:hypothetical protein
LRQNHSHILRF